MRLHVRDIVFPIREATLRAVLVDPYWCDQYNGGHGKRLEWALTVDTDPVEVDGERWQPSVYHESLAIPVTRWADIAGCHVAWGTPFDDVSGEPNGGFYLFEHDDLPTGSITFEARDGAAFDLKWTGTCNPRAMAGYDEDVPFVVDAQVLFKGILVHGSARDEEADLVARLSARLSLDGLLPQEWVTKAGSYESGVQMRSKWFLPDPSWPRGGTARAAH